MTHKVLSTYSSSSASSGHATRRSSHSDLTVGQGQEDSSEASGYAQSLTNCSISEKSLKIAIAQEKVYDIHADEGHITRTLHKLWVEEKLCDAILSVDNTHFKVHRVGTAHYALCSLRVEFALTSRRFSRHFNFLCPI